MIITTVKGAKFDTSKTAKSSVCTVINSNGRQELDTITLTGNTEVVKEFMEDVSMVEVDTSLGKTWVNEDFIWQ